MSCGAVEVPVILVKIWVGVPRPSTRWLYSTMVNRFVTSSNSTIIILHGAAKPFYLHSIEVKKVFDS